MKAEVKDSAQVECLRYGIVSTAHMTQADQEVLLEATTRPHGTLPARPWWIIDTDYGYQLRLHENAAGGELGGWREDCTAMGLSHEMVDNLQALADAGFDAVTFDQDGPRVDGLREFEW